MKHYQSIVNFIRKYNYHKPYHVSKMMMILIIIVLIKNIAVLIISLMIRTIIILMKI